MHAGHVSSRLWGAQIGGPDRWGVERCGADSTPSGESRFHTGDLVRSRGGGVYYLGRADEQVKLNGRRIELGPIGAAIRAAMHPLVRRAVVLLVDGRCGLHEPSDPVRPSVRPPAGHVDAHTLPISSHLPLALAAAFGRLHAFCAMSTPPAEDRTSPSYVVTSTAVRVLSGLELPIHLVPPGVTLLRDLPMTPTGKTDARALEKLTRERKADAQQQQQQQQQADDRAAASEWCPEGWLGVVAACWSLELGIAVGQLSAASDFRALSGDSLVALKICARLWRHQQSGASCPADGGVFGERMGAWGPVHLMTTPVLSEYAAMLQAAAAAAASCTDGTGVRGAELEPCDANAAAPWSPPAVTTARPSELDTLATQAVAAGEVGLLQAVLRRYTPHVPPSVADRLLLAAVHVNHSECVALMLSMGASPNATSACGAITVLQSAVQHKDCTPTVGRLLAACADVMALDDHKQTALHHAARAGADAGCIEALLSRPEADDDDATDVDADGGACGSVDVWGRTALHWAVINGHRAAIVALVEAGSDISLRDLQNESSLDLAERRALCQDVAETGKCDRLTVNLLKLMLPHDHPEYTSFHPTGFLDVCTAEVLGHAARVVGRAARRRSARRAQ